MDTKQKILITAFNLFLKNGYENTSLSEIAKMINITKPALYYYYTSKEALYLDVVEFFFSEMEKMINKIFSKNYSLKERTRSLFTSMNLMINYQKNFIQIEMNDILLKIYFFIYESIMKFPDTRNRMKILYKDLAENFKIKLIEAQKAGEIRDDLDADVLAFEFNALIEGIYLMIIFDPSIDIDSLGVKLFENYWKRLEKN